jgi:hypothetical protein
VAVLVSLTVAKIVGICSTTILTGVEYATPAIAVETVAEYTPGVAAVVLSYEKMIIPPVEICG